MSPTYEPIPRRVQAIIWNGDNDDAVADFVNEYTDDEHTRSLPPAFFREATVRVPVRSLRLWVEKSQTYAYDLRPGVAIIAEADGDGVYPHPVGFLNQYQQVEN